MKPDGVLRLGASQPGQERPLAGIAYDRQRAGFRISPNWSAARVAAITVVVFHGCVFGFVVNSFSGSSQTRSTRMLRGCCRRRY
jgi:hypothetical protein